MPSSKYFSQCPPFPSHVPVAAIPTISLELLAAGDQKEAANLFNASRKQGFFLLRLSESQQGINLLRDAETMFDLTHATLNLDKSVLDQFAFKPPADLLGYKKSGVVKTDDGQLDATEMYTLGQDDMLGSVLPRNNPEPVEQHRLECRQFFEHAYAAVAIILNTLDAQLGLPQGTLTERSALGKASATSLRLLLTRPQEILPKRITLGAHTDIGLVTMLFHVAGGLQVLPAGRDNVDENWRYIKPEPGCALINLGDTMVEWTGGVLRSSLHRVVTAPGQQNASTRVSLAYLVRPSRGESMRRLRGDGRIIPLANEGSSEDTRSVDEWAAERGSQILKGILKPQTNGGIALAG